MVQSQRADADGCIQWDKDLTKHTTHKYMSDKAETFVLEGDIVAILDQVVRGNWTQQEFVVGIENGDYPQAIKFSCAKGLLDVITKFNEGERVKVSFNINGKQATNGNFYNDLRAWRIERVSEGGEGRRERKPQRHQSRSQGRTKNEDNWRPGNNDEDDIPF